MGYIAFNIIWIKDKCVVPCYKDLTRKFGSAWMNFLKIGVKWRQIQNLIWKYHFNSWIICRLFVKRMW